MKTKVFTLLMVSLFLISCNKKEMEISRSDYSIITEMHDFSPAYITNENGKATMNKNNLIGNTHWIILAERDLSLSDVAPFLRELTDRKHKKGGMHEDTMDIYFIYSDTVHKQNAYVKLPFKKIVLDKPLEEEVIDFDKKMNVEGFVNKLIEFEKQGISVGSKEEVLFIDLTHHKD